MSEQLLSFEVFARDCEHQNEENDVLAECLHKKNYKDNCIESYCPLVKLASLADVRRLDPDNYESESAAFADELARGEDEDDLLPCDKGSDLVIVR